MSGDAYWQVDSDTYVSPFPAIIPGLLDDPERLRDSWSRALKTWQAQNELDGETVITAAEAYMASVRERATLGEK